MELRSSDEAAFRQVYDQVFPVIMKVAFHVTYNLDVSEDICQDAFIRFFDKNMVFETMDDAKFWLIRVTKNLAINQIKRKARETASIEKLKQVTPTSSYKDGASQLLFQESTESVRKAVAQLSEKYKTVIVLKEYAGLDYKQISKILNISESNVKVRVHRARKELEVLLGREDA
ncbi:MAG: RNA polymerase sigma factor [Sphaerochaetaceae bacterium]|jgi:RNA polymerase sigma-70 factor, ECF subfamily|nr:RNA polymerase sigma factor [Sphaerochaetaceae bacterium]NLY06853.1 RNA polymerase sigma factor [Spirochaetales bacterium]